MSSDKEAVKEDVPKFWLKRAVLGLLKRCTTTLDENFLKRAGPGPVPDLSYWEQPRILDTGEQGFKVYLEIHKVCKNTSILFFQMIDKENSILISK